MVEVDTVAVDRWSVVMCYVVVDRCGLVCTSGWNMWHGRWVTGVVFCGVMWV